MISLRLYGSMAVLAEDGRCLTPKGVKTQALVALLALAPGMTRSRAWLQDKLWSDRGPEQASGSLRQAIYQLRVSLGPDAGALICDRRTVGLDPARVSVLPRQPGEAADFLEGLDVRDPEFEDWLSLHRMTEDPPAAGHVRSPVVHRPADRATLLLRIAPGLPPDRQLLAQLVADMFAQALAERDLAEVRLGAEDDPADLRLDLTLFPGDQGYLRGQLQDLRTRRLCWSQTMPLRADPVAPFEQARLARFVNAGIEAAWQARIGARTVDAAPDCAMHLAVRRIFGYRREDLGAATDLLTGARDAAPVAWRIFLHMVQSIERAHDGDRGFLDELDELIHTALMCGPTNSLVLAAVANANIKILGRTDEGLILAHKAVRIGPYNPFAHDALMNGLIRAGRFQDAYNAARLASYIGRSTQAAHFFDMGQCLAALVTDRLEEASSLARRVVATAPSFRPALRYLAILETQAGRLDAADAALTRLRNLEQDFDPRRIAEDPNYPVASLRKSHLPRDLLRGFY